MHSHHTGLQKACRVPIYVPKANFVQAIESSLLHVCTQFLLRSSGCGPCIGQPDPMLRPTYVDHSIKGNQKFCVVRDLKAHIFHKTKTKIHHAHQRFVLPTVNDAANYTWFLSAAVMHPADCFRLRPSMCMTSRVTWASRQSRAPVSFGKGHSNSRILSWHSRCRCFLEFRA